MKSACLLIVASLTVCSLTVCDAQGLPAEDELDRRTTIDDLILHRAESLLLRSILNRLQDRDDRNDGVLSQPEWVTKRQHPGKRSGDYLEKRQHPGRREEDADEPYLDVQRRQHPGRREEEDLHSVAGIQRRQHPGRRAAGGHVLDEPVSLLGELSKRQHPGKRYLVLHSKRQHPGKRFVEEGEEEEEDGDDDWTDEGDEEPWEVEKRQHPGKRLWESPRPDLSTSSPCDVLDPDSCRKTSLLIDFLDNMSKSRVEEKRQHPGKRFEEESVATE